MDYSVIMIGKFAGNMCGLPIMTVLWTKGIGWGGFLLGLPYFTSGVSFDFEISSFCYRTDIVQVVYSLGVVLVTAIRLGT